MRELSVDDDDSDHLYSAAHRVHAQLESMHGNIHEAYQSTMSEVATKLREETHFQNELNSKVINELMSSWKKHLEKKCGPAKEFGHPANKGFYSAFKERIKNYSKGMTPVIPIHEIQDVGNPDGIPPYPSSTSLGINNGGFGSLSVAGGVCDSESKSFTNNFYKNRLLDEHFSRPTRLEHQFFSKNAGSSSISMQLMSGGVTPRHGPNGASMSPVTRSLKGGAISDMGDGKPARALSVNAASNYPSFGSGFNYSSSNRRGPFSTDATVTTPVTALKPREVSHFSKIEDSILTEKEVIVKSEPDLKFTLDLSQSELKLDLESAESDEEKPQVKKENPPKESEVSKMVVKVEPPTESQLVQPHQERLLPSPIGAGPVSKIEAETILHKDNNSDDDDDLFDEPKISESQKPKIEPQLVATLAPEPSAVDVTLTSKPQSPCLAKRESVPEKKGTSTDNSESEDDDDGLFDEDGMSMAGSPKRKKKSQPPPVVLPKPKNERQRAVEEAISRPHVTNLTQQKSRTKLEDPPEPLGTVEELNSDDDMTDDEDSFDPGDNILLGFFTKSKRKKDKRKINFKYCVLRINGQEQLLADAKGEFRWAAGTRDPPGRSTMDY